MTDENKDQETIPKEGQPQDQTDDQWDVVAGPDGKQDTQEAKPEPSEPTAEDKKKEREAFYQQEYEALSGAVKGVDPQFLTDWVDQRKDERKVPPGKAPAEAVASDEVVDSQEYVTRNDLEKLAGRIESTIGREREERRMEEVQRDHRQEYTEVNQAIVDFATKHKIPKEEHDRLLSEAGSFGANTNQPGGPSAFLRAYAKMAHLYLKDRKQDEGMANVQSEAEQKALAAKMTMQPSGSGIGVQPKRELTKEEKILDEMHALSSNAAAEEIFGK
jgi:hypothetical protein